MPETPIKPGDVVRWRQRLIDWNDGVVGWRDEDLTVACVIDERLYWCGFPPGSIPVSRAMLVESCSPEWERRTIEECARLQERNDPRRNWARAEALARGWRELDREDLTEEPRWVCVLVGADDLGMVSCETVPGGRWQWWSSREDGESGIADNKEAAVDALIAAENARRAKEKPHA